MKKAFVRHEGRKSVCLSSSYFFFAAFFFVAFFFIGIVKFLLVERSPLGLESCKSYSAYCAYCSTTTRYCALFLSVSRIL